MGQIKTEPKTPDCSIEVQSEAQERHLDNPNQYDENGCFINGSGVICLSCGSEWEDNLAVACCPCHDRD